MKPTNLEECFIELKKMLSEKDISFIAENLQNVNSCHHSLGRRIRNQWGLWEASELKEYFHNLGLHHPDDMSGLILKCFHYHLNNLPLQIDEQVKKYQEYWTHMSKEGNKRILIDKNGSITFVE